jgi:hypothetical protein
MQSSSDAPLLLGGRDQYLARIEDLLEKKEAALVLIKGKVGMGKTTFLRAVEHSARRVGYSVAGGLSVGRDTNELQFAHKVYNSLGVAPAAVRSTLELPPGVKPDVELHTSVAPASEGSRSPLTDVADALAAAAPVVVLIDEFRPRSAFLNRFVAAYLARVRKKRAAIVTVVGGRKKDLVPLESDADSEIVLERLDEAALRSDFESLGELEPPLTAEEIEVYVCEAARSPELAAALLHLLPLARPNGRSS